MITAITTWLIGRKIKATLARPLAWALTILAAALLIALGWTLLVRSITTKHDAGQRAEVAEEQLKNQGAADIADDALETADEADEDAVKGAITDAKHTDPARGATAAGPVTNAAVDQLRANRERRERKSPGD